MVTSRDEKVRLRCAELLLIHRVERIPEPAPEAEQLDVPSGYRAVVLDRPIAKGEP